MDGCTLPPTGLTRTLNFRFGEIPDAQKVMRDAFKGRVKRTRRVSTEYELEIQRSRSPSYAPAITLSTNSLALLSSADSYCAVTCTSTCWPDFLASVETSRELFDEVAQRTLRMEVLSVGWDFIVPFIQET